MTDAGFPRFADSSGFAIGVLDRQSYAPCLHAPGVAILSSMRTAEGEVRVEGFHDDVRLLSEADRAAIAEVPFDEQAYKDSIGVSELVGKRGSSPRLSARGPARRRRKRHLGRL